MINKSTTKMVFLDIVDRIKKTLTLKYDYEVANLIGLKRKAFSARKRSGRVPVDKLKIFCIQNSINYAWLVNEGRVNDSLPESEIQGHDSTSDMKLINNWSVRLGLASGDPLCFSPGGPLLFIRSKIWSKFRGPIKAFTIEGVDSSPHVKNGDIIIVACGEREVQGQHIYAIRTLFYLDVRHCHKEDRLLILNPRREGEPIETFDLSKSADPLVGRVIGIIKSHSD